MYYLAFLLLIATAVLAARLVVATTGRLKSTWVRRTIFWLIAVPVALVLNLAASFCVGDDVFFMRSPRCFLAVMVPPVVFLLSLLCFGFSGSRRQQSTAEPRARTWPVGRIAKRLGVSAVLLALSIPLFDWQLVSQLNALKADALATTESMSQPTIADAENAAVVYATLDQWESLLNDVKELVDAQRIDENGDDVSTAAMNLKLLPAARLQECEPAFDVLRAGSKLPGLYQRLEETADLELVEAPETTRLINAMYLLRMNALLKMERGESESACEDVRVLLRIGSQFEQDVQFEGRDCGAFAYHLASGCLAAILQSEEKLSDNDLRSFVVKTAAPEDSVYNACRWTGAADTIKLCNIYLDPRAFEQEASIWPSRFALGQFLMRLAHAQDDMTALKIRNDFYVPFSKRMDESQVIGQEMLDLFEAFGRPWLRSIPHGLLMGTDSRDWVIFSAMGGSDSRSLTSLMAAATLFEHKNDRYPVNVTELVPEFVAVEPVSRRDGLPFHFVAIENGLVICSSADESQIRDALKSEGVLRPATVEGLRAPQFLGKAYDQAHGLESDGVEHDKQ